MNLILSVKNKINKNHFASKIIYYLFLIIFGIIWGLGQRPNYLSVIRFFGLAPLLYIILYRKNYLLDSAIFGFVAYLMNFSWLYNTVIDFGEFKFLPELVGLSILSGLCFLYCLQYVIISFITRFMYRFNKKLLYFFPLVFILVDFLFPKIFNHSIGDGLIGLYYFIQIIDITGMTGIILTIMYSNVQIFNITKKIILKRKLKYANFIFIIPILIIFIYGYFRVEILKKDLSKAEYTKASMIQGNISGIEKRDKKKHQENLDRYNNLTRKAETQYSPDFIIWPESVFIRSYDGTDESLNKLLQDKYKNLVLGITHWSMNGEDYVLYNSCLYVVDGKVVNKYDKRHLLVFGEYIPFEDYLPFLNNITPLSISMKRGNTPSIFNIGKNVKACISICFEGIFPDEIRKKVNEGSNIMINITNDSWYGKGLGPLHHSTIARLRGIENRRSFFRCTPTGFTTASDYLGNVINHGSMWKSEIITANLPLYDKRTIYSYIGELFSYLSIIIIILTLLFIVFIKLKIYISSRILQKELNLQKRLGLAKNLGLKKGLGINKFKIRL